MLSLAIATQRYKTNLNVLVPSFGSANIVRKLKYLGMWLGPDASGEVWKAALGKYTTRLEETKRAGKAATTNITIYSSRIVPTLGYLAQWGLPPLSFRKKERYYLHSILRLLPSTLSMNALAVLPGIG